MEKLNYKGYSTTVRYDSESRRLHGKIDGISDFVNYVASDIMEVEEEFHSAVDDYLDFCKEIDKVPETPQAEMVDIDLPITVYQSLTDRAENSGVSLSQLITNIIVDKIPAKA